MSNIVKFRYSGFWNSEYPLVVKRLIDIVGSFDVATLKLEASYNKLASFLPNLAKIEVQEKSDSDSKRLDELDQIRDTNYNIIHSVAKNFQRSTIQEFSDYGHKIVSLVNKRKSDIPTTNYTAETKRLYDFIADAESQPEIMEAIEKLSLSEQFAEMKQANIDFDELFMERNKRQAENRIDVLTIRRECDKAITKLWSAIDQGCYEDGKEMYMPMLNIINHLNSYYKQQLTARATRRKAKQDVSKEDPIKPLENTGHGHWTPVPPRDNDKPFEK